MLIQHWTLDVADSPWLGKLRMICAVFFVLCALGLWAVAAGFSTPGGWWGDWLWPWPILLYLTWLTAMRPAPLLEASSQLQLTEYGELGPDLICHSLATPFFIALQLTPVEACRRIQPTRGSPKRWIWVIRDQLSVNDWTRLKRVCRSIALQSSQPGSDV